MFRDIGSQRSRKIKCCLTYPTEIDFKLYSNGVAPVLFMEIVTAFNPTERKSCVSSEVLSTILLSGITN
ncbi:MAG: hypothetical protein QM538_06410 [Methylacidiphilales bacterium]|nr:hypothetical protein [Candidatus Methylacidiphilales bacterium]